MFSCMNIEIEKVEVRKAKHAKEGCLQNGVAGLILKGLRIDLNNIPYRVTEGKEILVTVPGLMYSEQKAKGEKPISKLIPTVAFHDSAIWDAVVEAVKKEILVTLD